MKKLTLDTVQVFRLQEGHRHLTAVLSQIRSQPLQGEALELMKTLELAVQQVELVMICRPCK